MFKFTHQTLDFHDLMLRRITRILLVSSEYDSFLLSQDGQLHEQIASEFMAPDPQHPPRLTRLPTATAALDALRSGSEFDLIIITPHLGDAIVPDFAAAVRDTGCRAPIVLLIFDYLEREQLAQIRASSHIERAFMWQGDFRILPSIVRYLEDRWNVERDAELGAKVILLVEDDIRFYSSYLPLIYAELMQHSQRLISDSVNLYHKLLRLRARPKILFCDSYEEAWAFFERYEKSVLGLITDVEFPRGGELDRYAGVDLAHNVRAQNPDLPVLLQSSRASVGLAAQRLNVKYVMKDSPTLLQDVSRFMEENFGFGDFVFRLPDRTMIDRAADLYTLEQKLHTVPLESLRYHAERDHFSMWLKARTEFELADRLKPRKVADYPSLESLRDDLIQTIGDFRRGRTRGVVVEFHGEEFDSDSGFVRIADGSLGGKARGLAFINHRLRDTASDGGFQNIRISVPPTAVVCTGAFDRFLDANALREFALRGGDDVELQSRFQMAVLPGDVQQALASLVRLTDYPLAVRSSSLFEDSQIHPYAGVYETVFLPNHHENENVRMEQLCAAVKRVYASVYSSRSRRYAKAAGNRLEEERMAVIIQKLVGARHRERYYPDISGVARSHNFYPTAPMLPEDGIVSVALGFGKTVTDGGVSLRFCPRYPRHLIQLATTRDILEHTQKTFFALDLRDAERITAGSDGLSSYELADAESDGVLAKVASVYSPDDDRLYEGLSRPGARVIDFSPILKNGLFPLADLSLRLMELGTSGMSGPVEMEFAANLGAFSNDPAEFAILQVRPYILNREQEDVDIEDYPDSSALCKSTRVLGVGREDSIRDIIVVDSERYERRSGKVIADIIGEFNLKMTDGGIPYLLIGPGRWGSSDPWLGIPVVWEQISGARVIIESALRDCDVTPSEGSHFFHRLTTHQVGYFTAFPGQPGTWLDWPWLNGLPSTVEKQCVRHIRLAGPLSVKMNGQRNQGIILKPGVKG